MEPGGQIQTSQIQLSTRISGCRIISDSEIQDRPLWFKNGTISTPDPDNHLEMEFADHDIFPGLINGHDHLQLNSDIFSCEQPVFTDSKEWAEWINKDISNRRNATGARIQSATRYWQGGLKNILSGVTTVAHHDPVHEVMKSTDFPVRFVPCTWCHSIAFSHCYGPGLLDSIRLSKADQPWIMHIAEGTGDTANAEFDQFCKMTSLQKNMVFVHCVGFSDLHFNQVKAHCAGIVWCPVSNLTILNKTLKITEMMKTGKACIGTDSRLSGGFDLLAELKIAASLADLPAIDLIQMVTRNAANILQTPLSGHLQLNSHADFIIVKRSDDPWNTLIQSERKDFRAVVKAGKPIVADPDFRFWFEKLGSPVVEITMDGKKKLLDKSVMGSVAALELEPGVALIGQHDHKEKIYDND